MKEDPEQFRNLIKQVTGKPFSTEQVKNFLDIFEHELDTAIVKAKREFIIKHFTP